MLFNVNFTLNVKFLLLSLFLFVKFADSNFVIKDRTPPYINDKYADTVSGCSLEVYADISSDDGVAFTVTDQYFIESPEVVSSTGNNDRQLLKLQYIVPIGTTLVGFKITTDTGDSPYTLLEYKCEAPPVDWISSLPQQWLYSNQVGYYTKFKFNFSKRMVNLLTSLAPNNFNFKIFKTTMKMGEFIVMATPAFSNTALDFSSVIVQLQDGANMTVTHKYAIPGFIRNISVLPGSIHADLYPNDKTSYLTPLSYYYAGSVEKPNGLYMYCWNKQKVEPMENRMVSGNPDKYGFVFDFTETQAAYTQLAFTYIRNYQSNQVIGKSITTTPPPIQIFGYGSTLASSQYFNNVAVIRITFSSTQYLNLAPDSLFYNYAYISDQFYLNPFTRIYSGNYKNAFLDVIASIPRFNGPSIFSINQNLYSLNNADSTDTLPPQLNNLSLKSFGKLRVLITASISDDVSGFYRMVLYSGTTEVQHLNYTDIIDGTYIVGNFQKYVDFLNIKKPYLPIDNIALYDFAGNLKTYTNGFYNFNPIPTVPEFITNIEQNYEIYQITSIRFALNDIDLSNIGAQNAIYFNISNANRQSGVAITFFINVRNTDPYKYVFYGGWNQQMNMFSINFDIPSHVFTGNVEYSIWYPDLEFTSIDIYTTHGFSSLLRVFSQNADAMPPIFTSLAAFPSDVININTDIEFGWDITVSDDNNGFKYGLISVISDLDGYEHNFTYTNENKVEPYYMPIRINQTCITQIFQIKYIYLEDYNGVFSEYKLNSVNQGISPLMKFSPISINLNCVSPSMDTIAPVLSNMTINKENIILVNSPTKRAFNMSFCIRDADSEISTRHLPYCMVTGLFFDHYVTRSTLVNVGSKSACFKCKIELPYMHGGPWTLTTTLGMGIYGYSDLQLNFGGTGTNDITEISGYSNIVVTNTNLLVPYITSTSTLTTDGGDLTVYGKNFGDTNATLTIYPAVGNVYKLPSVFVNNVFAVFKNVPSLTLKGKYKIELYINTGSSNQFFIVISPAPVPIIIPSTPPTQCLGTPLCGGPNNGDCIANKCQCKDPWIGNDCLSQNIIIKPIINTTSPDTGNDYKTDLDGKDVSLKTLVSIVSLNEINKDGSINFSYNFTNWKYTNVTSATPTNNKEYLYETDVPYGGINTTVKVTLKYFHNKDTVEFAGETFDILPSTLKYQISISPFKFQSSLNTLQLIMASSIQSDTNDYSCTYQEQGNSPDSDADYVKLQVNEHSLYGRFIKRAIIDNRIQTISNTFQNGESQSTQIQNQVAINIPNFQYLVIMDPDYSVLIDSQKASDQSTSTCGQPTEGKGLTKTQLIGIIIGSVAIGIIAIILISYFLYKKSSSVRVLMIKLKPIPK
ncbi:hypothetical protein DLAC_07573 [Tieghemostelium lacteum]|uniref:EGF-like domain-containing protein n=1 Tax=Tieghemostelium lacteum TaxID=361077 RepID=A0A151ZCX5_TIELA|nr:hypothetical protein DLAC_07573 [Tieghemostelium lacteum]|eukprot:KYQ91779.1 hypothetical protein DLAC_07573 [Tieghemostelium lacteum]